jgi:cytochrome b561
MEKTKKITIRAMVSTSLFFLIIILFITAVGMQILDLIIDPETLISMYLSQENQPKSFLVELQHVIKAVHVIAGFIFVALSIIHIIKNWKALKEYFDRIL